MRKTEYTILKKPILKGSLVSTTSQNWYNSNGGLTPWSGSDFYIGPNIGDGIFNFTSSVDGIYNSSVPQGYYKWTGLSWSLSPISGITEEYNLPIFLESSADEMGNMVSFDGEVEQIEQLCNFTYTITGNTLYVFNSVNPDKLRKIIEQDYTIDWGVKENLTGNTITGSLKVNTGSLGSSFPVTGFDYTIYTSSYSSSINTGITGSFDVTIYLNSPWSNQRLTKTIVVPTSSNVENPFGTFTGITIPAYSNLTGQTQDYLNNLDYTNNTGYTAGYTGFTYLAIGGSRLGEFRQYGTTTFSGITDSGSYTDGVTWTGYTIDGFYYRDRSDGYTMITGNTTGYTKEEVVNYVITRNEHFLGFIDDPQVYSDIFVERGKQGVLEKNLRLGEIDNMDELEIYGNGYFKIRKS